MDMQKTNVDVLISAPQKGWSGPACCGLVMMNARARAMVDKTENSSFSADLARWTAVMEKYEQPGGFMYHTTLPTDSIMAFRDSMLETKAMTWKGAKDAQQDLGDKMRQMLAAKGFKSVAAKGFEAPGVVVSYAPSGTFLYSIK